MEEEEDQEEDVPSETENNTSDHEIVLSKVDTKVAEENPQRNAEKVIEDATLDQNVIIALLN